MIIINFDPFDPKRQKMMTEFLIMSEEQLLKDGDKLVLRPQQTRLDGEGDRLVVSKYDEGIPDWQKAEENPTKVRDEVRPNLIMGKAIQAGYWRRLPKADRKLHKTDVTRDWQDDRSPSEVTQDCTHPVESAAKRDGQA